RKTCEKTLAEASVREAISYLKKNEYCNPHLLVKDKIKERIRYESFLKLLENSNVYFLNTIETPEESLKRIIKLLDVKEEMRRWEVEGLRV
ncbi:MAG: hypothetical protein QXI58_07915, partial [Candidatus Micrarchaeia archaeon]